MSGNHRGEPKTPLAHIISSVRSQMSDQEIVAAAQALTIGDAAYLRTIKVLGRRVKLENRGPDALTGRFGGGWMINVGIQTGRRGLDGTVIVNLGKGSIRIDPVQA